MISDPVNYFSEYSMPNENSSTEYERMFCHPVVGIYLTSLSCVLQLSIHTVKENSDLHTSLSIVCCNVTAALVTVVEFYPFLKTILSYRKRFRKVMGMDEEL